MIASLTPKDKEENKFKHTLHGHFNSFHTIKYWKNRIKCCTQRGECLFILYWISIQDEKAMEAQRLGLSDTRSSHQCVLQKDR